MASASSSAARSLIRDGKAMANLLFRARTANLTATETVQNTGPSIRSLFWFNQTPASQYPVFSKTFPVMQSRVGFVQQEEVVSERIEKMEAAQGKRVVDSESSDSEEEPYFDEDADYSVSEIDDVDEDEDDDDDDVDDDDEEEEEDKHIRKKK